MPDQEPPATEMVARITKLEEQTRELQRQVTLLNKQQKRKKRSGNRSELRSALNSDVTLRMFGVLLLLSLLPFFGPIFVGAFLPTSMSSAIPSPPWEILALLPGGKAVWMPLWQVSILLTFLIGVATFVASRD